VGREKSREGTAAGVLTLDGFIMPLEADIDAGEFAAANITNINDGHLSTGH